MSGERTTEIQQTPERQGLVGAMPVGERWRAQGYIGGQTRYLGTFDSEEEAHKVFIRAKETHQAEQEASAREAVEKIMASPTFEYRGGVGRGATHNGRLFKIIEARGPHHSAVVPLTGDGGIPDFMSQTVVTTAYLYERVPTTAIEVSAKAEASSTTPQDKTTPPDKASPATVEDVIKFVSRNDLLDVGWALDFAARFVVPDSEGNIRETLQVLRGHATLHESLWWLRAYSTVPVWVLDKVTQKVLANVFVTDDLRREAKAYERAFGTSHPLEDACAIPEDADERPEAVVYGD